MLTKEQYQNQRQALMDEAEKLIGEGNTEDANAKMKEIESLDSQWEAAKTAQANLEAMKDSDQAADLQNYSADVDGQPFDSMDNRAKQTDEQELYKNAWAKDMMDAQLTQDEKTVYDKINNAAETAKEHQVAIPETVRRTIWEEAGKLYPIIGDARMTHVPGKMTIIKETDSGSDAEWYDENTEVKDGSFALGELNLTGCELSKSVPISWKLRKMSIESFIPYITSLLAEKMGAALAKGIMAGKGKPSSSDDFKAQPRGILTALKAQSKTPQIVNYNPDASTADPLTYDKLAEAMGLMKSQYKSGSVIYATSKMIWSTLAKIKDNDGRPLFVPDVNNGGVGRIFGLVIKEEDSVPDDNTILIGNVSRGYALNVNENATIYKEDHIKQRYTDYMSYSIVDGDVLTENAFAAIVKK